MEPVNHIRTDAMTHQEKKIPYSPPTTCIIPLNDQTLLLVSQGVMDKEK
jgi:hypothetical protein